MPRTSREKILKIALALWGGSLGFPVGVALMAWAGKRLGWWPPSPRRLLKYVETTGETSKNA
jgi:hypothetical protein